MTEFERFACYDKNIGTATLSRYGADLSNHINPAVIEERKLNATSIDVFSRLLMDRVIWLGCPIDDDADRNYWMTAEDAKAYGMIDRILVKQ